jgi:tungstate transport system permease protein
VDVIISEILSIALLSIIVSGTAVAISTFIGVPLGIYLANNYPRPNLFLTSILNTSVGLPPVLVGLVLYLLFFNRGIFGSINILFTPLIMIFAQVILTLPIIISITRSSVADISKTLPDLLESLGATNLQKQETIWKEAKQGVYIGIIMALGRAFSEVGAVIIVGGNLRGFTRVLTTAIITETSKGNYELSLGLGIVLLSISFSITIILTNFQLRGNFNSD